MARLAVVVPTYNERDNVAPLVDALSQALAGLSWEVVFVDDDSPDGTAARARELAKAHSNVRVVQRIGRRGLATAAIEGILATTAPLVAVMDGDLQHDERLLPRMLARLEDAEDLDLVIASRFAEDASLGDFAGARRLISRAGIALSRLVLPAGVTDPLSGFFMVRRRFFDQVAHRLSGRGFKILVDLLASAPGRVRFVELPFHFRRRLHGASKLDAREFGHYLALIADKAIGRALPVRLLVFAGLAALALLGHLAVLAALHRGLAIAFVPAQAAASVAVTAGLFALLVPRRALRLAHAAGLALPGLALGPWLAAELHGAGAGWALAGVVGGAASLAWSRAVARAAT
jgi:dolichol-phosphate mannosyltransferase